MAVVVAAGLAVPGGAAAAADIESPPPQPAPPASAILAPPDAACLEWTDGCRVCQKPPAGDAACSNVSIACVPQPLRCTRQPEK